MASVRVRVSSFSLSATCAIAASLEFACVLASGVKLPRSAAAKAARAGSSGAAISVSDAALCAARLPDKKRALRLCMVALLEAKAVTRKWVEQAVAVVARAVPGFKPTPEQWRGEAGRVGEYRAPGVYHLRPGLAAELDALRKADPAQGAPPALPSSLAVRLSYGASCSAS